MANEHTVARPYAKALFEYALEHNSLANWSNWLQRLADLSCVPAFKALSKNPALTSAQLADIIIAIARELSPSTWMVELDNLIKLLISNRRLSALPTITAQFKLLQEAQEKTLCVDVSSFVPLTSSQVERLVARLSQRFARKVTLNQTIDPSLLGGVLIRAHDVVIDGSIQGQLVKLSADLAGN
jgi:F-type H+-transporting ATPase subunit delta